MERKVLSREDYAKNYLPFGAWIVVRRHGMSEKIGSIFIPKGATESNLKFSMTGVVIAKSPFKEFEFEWESYWMSKVNIGDIVGFSSQNVITSPAPPDVDFDGDDRKGMDLVTLHIGDVRGVWTETEEGRKELEARFSE